MDLVRNVERLAMLARLENSVDKASEAIAAAETLATQQEPDASFSTLILALNLRSTWGLDFATAFTSTVQRLESSPLQALEKKAHRRAIAAVTRRTLSTHPELQTWLDSADLIVTESDVAALQSGGG